MTELAQPRERDRLRPSQEALRPLHYDLMAAYADAIRRGSLLPGLLKGKAVDGDPDGFKASASGPITRTLLSAHLRDRMRLLGAVYVQLSLSADPESEGEYAKWLTGAAADCESFERSLPSFSNVLKAIRIPGLSLLAGVVLQGSDLLALQIAGTVLILLSVSLGFVGVRSSFRLKRDLLLPGAYRLDAESREEQGRHPGFNVYRAEERLAHCLGYRKPREVQLDYLVLVGTAPLALAIPVALCVALGLGMPAIVASCLIFGAGTLVAVQQASVRWQRRRWR